MQSRSISLIPLQQTTDIITVNSLPPIHNLITMW